MNPIAIVNVSLTQAPTPSTLQQSGALISTAGTNTSPGTTTLLTGLPSLTTLLSLPAALTSLSWTGGVVTATATADHGLTIGDEILLTIAGAVPAAYNGTYLCTVTTATEFTYLLASSPGTETTPGTWVTYSTIELTEMATTFFAQGNNTAVSVFECGPIGSNLAIAFLDTWIAANPRVFYSYTVPREWDNQVYDTWSANVLTAISWSGGYVTATTTTDHGVLPGQTFSISGCVPSAYNGTFVALPGTTGETLIWAYATAISVETTLGTLVANAGVPNPYLAFVSQFENPSSMTYFFTTTTLATYTQYSATQKSVLAMVEAPVYGTWPANALTAISWTGGVVTAATTTNHGILPGQWFTIAGCTPNAYNGVFQALPGTTGTALLWNYPTSIGSETVLGTLVASLYSSTGIPSTEFSVASTFYDTLNYNPSPVNKVTPLNYTFEYGVTAFPQRGNQALISTLTANAINYIGTGAEGGISNTLVTPGQTLDGNDFTFWYSIDYAQINLNLAISNAVINGSNNRINPLYYNQQGINSLQAVCVGVMNTMVSVGLALGTVVQTELTADQLDQNLDAGMYAGLIVVNAIPFAAYAVTNPSDYKIGRYAGLSVIYTPARGFEQIIVGVNVTEFVAP